MKFCGFDIDDKSPCVTISECGINHNGSMETALKMIDVAKDCGADIIKFQKRDLESLYRKDVLISPSDESHSLGIYIPILKQCELTEKNHIELKARCEEVGIKYLCSPWDLKSLSFLESMGVEGYKLPSACLTDLDLIQGIWKTGKPLIISTGMHSEEELITMRAYFHAFIEDKRLAVLHCVSSYPTADKDVNLGYMETLRKMFEGCEIGYSGHERGIPISVASVAMGARIVERHFTLDRTMSGPDHASSLEAHGLDTLVRHIRSVESAMGCVKKMNQGEVMARETLSKILVWSKSHGLGDKITRDSFKIVSPGYGVPAYELSWIVNGGDTITTKEVVEGQPLKLNEINLAKGVKI